MFPYFILSLDSRIFPIIVNSLILSNSCPIFFIQFLHSLLNFQIHPPEALIVPNSQFISQKFKIFLKNISLFFFYFNRFPHILHKNLEFFMFEPTIIHPWRSSLSEKWISFSSEYSTFFRTADVSLEVDVIVLMRRVSADSNDLSRWLFKIKQNIICAHRRNY